MTPSTRHYSTNNAINKHDEHQQEELQPSPQLPLSSPRSSSPTSSATSPNTTNTATTSTNLKFEPQHATTTLPPPTVYGELSILGYNGYIPSGEKNGRRSRSKFLLCQRSTPNGIKKSRHYIVKQPQATKAIQDKELHSISFTFSRSQTIIVEYKQDETTDMFQIGRSSEDPIDFVVMDTLPAGCNLNQSSSSSGSHYRSSNSKNSSSNSHHQHSQQQLHHAHQQHNENASSSHHHHQQQQQLLANDFVGLSRLHRHLAKVGEEMLHYGFPPGFHDQRARLHMHVGGGAGNGQHNQALPINYTQPSLSNLPPMLTDHLRSQNHQLAHQQQQTHPHQQQHYSQQPMQAHPSSSSHSHHHTNHHQQFFNPPSRSNNNINGHYDPHGPGASGVVRGEHNNNITSANNNSSNDTNNNNLICKRSRTTQSTISRFACRILVDRKSPCTARVYAAGFDSSKNIFLGEKATKWEQNNTIDGLTTNGILLMHPKRSSDCSTEYGGVWREVSVDGGIYAIRESRSAIQKGKRIEDETNILQDGTLIDLCGATLLWRSVDGFKSSPTKKTLEEKIDLLNASRPQCPVGLNTLVIPRKPILPNSHQHANNKHSHHHHHHHNQLGGGAVDDHRYHNSHRSHSHHHNHHQYHHHNHSNNSSSSSGSNNNLSSDSVRNNNEKSSHQPYVYLKCGHVQGYHDWGTTEKSNQRTCPICLSVGTVAKLSMGLEPSFYVDSGSLSHVFNPCGHMASESTIKYWCSIKIPHGTHFFHSICPFCATPLTTSETPWTKLIFQDDLD